MTDILENERITPTYGSQCGDVAATRPHRALAALRWLLFGCGYAYVIALLVWRLDVFPALHGDEAWFGLFALRIVRDGLFTPDGMNWYTGSLYGYLLSRVFTVLSPGIGSMRLLGVVANAIALLLLAAHFGARRGAGGALALLALWAATPLLVIKLRIAWEVYALQPLFLVSLWILVYRIVGAPRRRVGDALWFLAVAELGVVNHVIFAAVPLSLAVLATAFLVRDTDEPAEPIVFLCRLAAVALALAAATLISKFFLSDQVWQVHRASVLAGCLVAWVAGAAAALSRRFDTELVALLRRAAGQVGMRYPLGRIAGLAVAVFIVVHGLALVRVGSGIAVFERVMSWPPPPLVALAFYMTFGIVVALAAAAARRAWMSTSPFSLPERIVVLWPFAYMTIFTLFRLDAPVRHYLVLILLIVAAAAHVKPAPSSAWRLGVGVIAVALAISHVAAWREISHPETRRPLAVRIGWVHDTSKHFLPLDPLYAAMERNHACSVISREAFLEAALRFFSATHDLACDPAKTIVPDYCPNCPAPPYLTWKIDVAVHSDR